jgi:arginase
VRISLIAVPYDLGRADVGSGRGPGVYLKAGAAESLRARGHHVDVATVRRETPFADELQAVLAVDGAVASAVEEAVRGNALPLVVAGNCNAALGVRAGLRRGEAAETALVWLDAHGDFNTPATTETGYLDGMPLAMLCGRAYGKQVASVLGVSPIDEAAVLHAGGRELDHQEQASLAASAVRVVEGRELRDRGPAEALAPALDALVADLAAAAGAGPDAPAAHLHIDLDVLDPAAAPGVTFPSPRGLSAGQLLEAIDLVRERFSLAAVTVASFTPERDDAAGTTLAVGLAVLQRATSEARERLTR